MAAVAKMENELRKLRAASVDYERIDKYKKRAEHVEKVVCRSTCLR